MKLVVIGDIHGHSSWKDVLENENNEFDKVIFLGDYLDGFNVSIKNMQKNFYEILDYKQEQSDKCILLLGNHDWHYVSFGERYSGWKNDTFRWANLKLKECLQEEVIKIVHIEDDILFSHAGLTKSWLKHWFESNNPEKVKCINYNDISPSALNFTFMGGGDVYGDSVYSSPIWVRPASLLLDRVDKYKQVVGHTMMKSIISKDNVWFCDTMPREYLVIQNGEFIIKTLNKD